MKKQIVLSLSVLLSLGSQASANQSSLASQWQDRQGYTSEALSGNNAAAIGYTEEVLTKDTPAGIGYTEDVLLKETPAAIGYTPDVLTKETPAGIGYTEDVLLKETPAARGYTEDLLLKETPAGVGYTPERLQQGSTVNTDALYPDRVYSDEVRISVPEDEFERINRKTNDYSISPIK